MEDLLFDDLPEELQYSISDLADAENKDIEEIWLEVQMGDQVLPRNLQRQLKAEARRKAREEAY